MKSNSDKVDNKKRGKRSQKIIVVIVLIIIYVLADLFMDKTLFPLLSESLQEYHRAMVSKYMILLNLVWLWLIGFISFTKLSMRNNNTLLRLAIIIFGSALVATVLFSFTMLPLIWAAYTSPSTSSIFLFLHDYGIFLYFFILIPVFGYKYFKKQKISNIS